MRIVSTPRVVNAYVGRDLIQWTKGSHTANVYNACNEECDVFTFAWEKNEPAMLDFTTALQSYLDYVNTPY